MLRTIFFGTSDFSLPSLITCAQRTELCAIITQPDKQGDRGKPALRPIAKWGRDNGIDVLQPIRIRDEQVVRNILNYGADAIIVAAYGQILPVSLLDGHRLGGINVHGSLLPRWRGASPIAAAILAGDTTTGISIMQMEAGLDCGAVYAQSVIPLDSSSTLTSVTRELSVLGAALLADVLEEIQSGDSTLTPQDESQVTLAPLLSREDGVCSWETMDARDIDRRVRALNPWPGVVITVNGESIKIIAGSWYERHHRVEPGTIIDIGQTYVDVAARSDIFRLELVQPAGKRVMDAGSYARGRRLSPTTSGA